MRPLSSYSSTQEEKQHYTDSTPIPEATETENRYITDRHRVLAGESISYITGAYWEDIFLWPELYIRNELLSDDPDLVYIDEIVNIYNRLGRDTAYTESETEQILDAYIEVYDRFKALGSHKNGSAWTLLWCGTKYDRNFLNRYVSRIEPHDMEMAQKYIDEEGFLD